MGRSNQVVGLFGHDPLETSPHSHLTLLNGTLGMSLENKPTVDPKMRAVNWVQLGELDPLKVYWR